MSRKIQKIGGSHGRDIAELKLSLHLENSNM